MDQPVQYELIEGHHIQVEMKKESSRYLISDSTDAIKISSDFALSSQPIFHGEPDFSTLLPDAPYPTIEKSKNRGQIALCGLSRREKKKVEKLRTQLFEKTNETEVETPKKSKKKRKMDDVKTEPETPSKKSKKSKKSIK